MLSISKPMSASAACSYFFGKAAQKADYYLKEGCEWHGKGAESLGLVGQASKEEALAVMAGLHPQTGEALIEAKGGRKANGDLGADHRAGIDLTFSAPKSFSIAALADPSLIELHDGAVRDAMEYVENHYSFARQTVDGETRVVATGNLCMMRARHIHNREYEVHMHDHVFVMSSTQREDGQWRATHNDNLYKDQKKAGML